MVALNVKDSRGTLSERLERNLIPEPGCHSKLTEDQVRGILADTGSQESIAARYGTTQTNVSSIKRRATWGHLSLALILVSILFCGQAMAQNATYVYTPMGYQQISAVPTGTFLTVPTGARMVEICVSTQAIRYRDDGTAPTASVGMPVPAATCFTYSGSLPAIQFIQQTGTAVLDALFYR